MRVVLSLGGGIINPDGKPDVELIKKMGSILVESKYDFGIVTGGGRVARIYAEAARELGANEFEADEVAIITTKQNAKLLIAALGEVAYPKVLNDFDDAAQAAFEKKVVVMGGTIPGITTDTDSVLLAEKLHAKRLVNISNVDAIYSANPRTNPKAKRYEKLTYEQLIKLAVEGDKRMAGQNFVFDLLACKLAARSKIELHFVSGKNVSDIENAIEGKKHSGTVVRN
ncbi:UMP kinase [Candidatus Micrarchaeota archaeon]|nr:UMP kinase [Candidatus Micrarchaeota archaeon]